MASRQQDIAGIERRLRQRLGRFLHISDSVVPSLPAAITPISVATNEVLRLLRDAGLHAYIWGGVVRDLIAARRIRLPRDVDIVVDGARNDDVWRILQHLPSRRNRFGGVHVEGAVEFDVFAVPDAWTFRSGFFPAGIEYLPRTTFLDVEAVVVDTEVSRGRARRVFSHGFFESMADRRIEINYQNNPYPALCIVRSFEIARHLDFAIGHRLAAYLVTESARFSGVQLEEAQRSHYGAIKYTERDIRQLVASIKAQVESDSERISLPGSSMSQGSLWLASRSRIETGEKGPTL